MQTYSAQELDAAKSRVTQCLVKQARALDDRISPADSVAIGVVAACQGEIDVYDKMRVQGAGTLFTNTFYKNRHIGWHKTGVMTVLNNRANR